MAIVCRWISIFLTGVSCVAASGPNTAENRSFNAAAEAFRSGFFDLAEKDFANFATKYPGSTRLAEATLLRAQCQIQLTNYTQAVQLLKAGKPTAGSVADQFTFWEAQAALRLGNAAEAADLFAQVVKDYSTSSNAFEAQIDEAAARASLGQWEPVSTILNDSKSPFQVALNSGPPNTLVFRGALLLSEALLERGETGPAEKALQPLANQPLEPLLQWQRDFLLCRLRQAESRLDGALEAVTNLVKLAATLGDASRSAEANSLHGLLLARSGRTDAALRTYTLNLAPGLPESYQKEALLRVAEISFERGTLLDAAKAMDMFASQHTNSPIQDAVLLVSGDLKLRQYASSRGEVSTAPSEQGTNLLSDAAESFTRLLTAFPASPLCGKANLGLGWCYWLQGRVPQSQEAFRKAQSLLPKSTDHAIAGLKLGDTELSLGQYTNAIASYSRVVEAYGNDPQSRSNFVERALYQTVRAAIAARDPDAANHAIGMMLRWFPGRYLFERAILLNGIEVSRYNPVEAQGVYSEFLKAFPDAALVPQVKLALARSYEQQGNWTNAIAQYENWLALYTNDPAIARAEYSRAWGTAQTGNTNAALTLFTNFVARFPTSEFAPMAQWWVGDFYLQTGQYENAERGYKMIFQSTNWPASELTYQARMMAGRAAFARQSATQAAEYFTGLWNDTNCPSELRAQALFAYGDTLMTMEAPETNKVANYDEAIRVFSRITELYPTNRIGALAWGQKASCLLQWAQTSQQYSAASNAFQQVISSPYPDPRARAIAKVGLASVLEKQAELVPNAKAALLKQAMDHYLEVFFGLGDFWKETADPFWVNKAGLEAARLAESQGQWSQAVKIYQRLQELMPELKARMEKNAARAQEHLVKAGQSAGPLKENK